MQFEFISKENLDQLPIVPGVYVFKSPSEVLLYIGKAINLKSRVKNHFSQPTFKDAVFIPKTQQIGYIATDSEIEALILEAELIKKYRPDFNSQWKDNKNYFFVAITKDVFPRVFVTHQTKENFQYIGPFIDSFAIKQAVRILRKIFPFRSCFVLPKKPCLYRDLDLCLAPCSTFKDTKLYRQNIKNLIKVLKGQKRQVLKDLQNEMQLASQKQDYEKAQQLKEQIGSLENVFRHSHILNRTETNQPQSSINSNWKKIATELQKTLYLKCAIAKNTSTTKIERIEAYDISNIQGQQATGSMVVFTKGLPDKKEYRKFKIKITGQPNDTVMIKEMLTRRLKHKEWPLPQIMLIDGGKPQINIAIKTVHRGQTPITLKIVALAKRQNELFIENKAKPILLKTLTQDTSNLILHLRDEAHRFAITYHKKLRRKNLFA
ncbi:MAG: UvrB/UvrC motif-containing protein [Candidatus Gribaldobacteria bacterium]|nr:UvrB/UvrC motif-containing protein [Candidatus Gribaldobacteria bacterium]